MLNILIMKKLLLLFTLIFSALSFGQTYSLTPINVVYEDSCTAVNQNAIFTFAMDLSADPTGACLGGSTPFELMCNDAFEVSTSAIYSGPFTVTYDNELWDGDSSYVVFELAFELGNLSAPYQDSIYFTIEDFCGGTYILETYIDYQNFSWPGSVELWDRGPLYKLNGVGVEFTGSELFNYSYSDNATQYYDNSFDFEAQSNEVFLPYTFPDTLFYTTKDNGYFCDYGKIIPVHDLNVTTQSLTNPYHCGASSENPSELFYGTAYSYQVLVDFNFPFPQPEFMNVIYDFKATNLNNLDQQSAIYYYTVQSADFTHFQVQVEFSFNSFDPYEISMNGIPFDTIGFIAEDPIEYDIFMTEESCAEVGDGLIDFEQISGPSIASINWYESYSGQNYSTEDIVNASEGEYHLYVSSVGGCTYSGQFFLNGPNEISLDVIQSSAGCGQQDGQASAIISGGNPPYSISWSNGVQDQTTITDLAAGFYYITVVDDDGCSKEEEAIISNDEVLVFGDTYSAWCGEENGAIDIFVIGFAPPYTYSWSNGATSQDLIGVGYGPYEVTVTDASGCIGMAQFDVYQTSAIEVDLQIGEASCGSADGYVQIDANGGTGNFSYTVMDNQQNIVGNSSYVSGLPAGTYTVEVEDGQSCTFNQSFTISENGAPEINLESITEPNCDNTGAIDITVTTAQSYTVDWSNGGTTDDISGLSSGIYTVVIEDNSGCFAYAEYEVGDMQPAVQEICLVSVEDSTNRNLIVWEKPASSTISHYNIYRETSQSGLYQLVDSVLYSDESIFVDSVANPQVKSWRYKISAVSVCGVESDLSPIHKTIHLAKNVGIGGEVNLAWTDYEGFTYTSVDLWRYTDVNGWEIIQSLSSTEFSYTDLTVPASAVELDYVIDLPLSDPCTSTKVQDHNSSRSNRTISGGFGDEPTDGIDENTFNGLTVYPNPNNGLFTISVTSPEMIGGTIEIYDMQGKLISTEILNSELTEIDLSYVNSGIYTVRLITEVGTIQKQVTIQ